MRKILEGAGSVAFRPMAGAVDRVLDIADGLNLPSVSQFVTEDAQRRQAHAYRVSLLVCEESVAPGLQARLLSGHRDGNVPTLL